METDMQKKEIYANFKHSSPNISFINKNEQLKITKHLGKPRVTKSKDKKAEWSILLKTEYVKNRREVLKFELASLRLSGGFMKQELELRVISKV